MREIDMLAQLRQNPFKYGDLFCPLQVGLKLTGPDYFLGSVIDADYLASQGSQQESER